MTNEFPDIGTDAAELASAPGLMVDLALSLVPRRLALASGLLALLGGMSREKVRSILAEVAKLQAELTRCGHHGVTDQLVPARDLLAAVAKLENAIFTLVIARTKHGLRPIPPVLAS